MAPDSLERKGYIFNHLLLSKLSGTVSIHPAAQADISEVPE
jgi:hypothetical protein